MEPAGGEEGQGQGEGNNALEGKTGTELSPCPPSPQDGFQDSYTAIAWAPLGSRGIISEKGYRNMPEGCGVRDSTQSAPCEREM